MRHRGRRRPQVGHVQRGDPRGGRATARAAAAQGRGGRRRQEPVRGRAGPRTSTELIDFGEWLGDELMDRAKEALGSPVEAYGKGGIVGEQGETEHVAALPPPEVRGTDRAAAGGVSILPSVKKRGAMGAHLDIPVHHIKAMLVRCHFDAMEICVPDAPGDGRARPGARGDQRRPAARARRRAAGRGRRRRGRAPLGGRPGRCARLSPASAEVVSGDIAAPLADADSIAHRGRPDRGDRARARRRTRTSSSTPTARPRSRAHRLATPTRCSATTRRASGRRLHRVGAPRRRDDGDLGGRGPPARAARRTSSGSRRSRSSRSGRTRTSGPRA